MLPALLLENALIQFSNTETTGLYCCSALLVVVVVVVFFPSPQRGDRDSGRANTTTPRDAAQGQRGAEGQSGRVEIEAGGRAGAHAKGLREPGMNINNIQQYYTYVPVGDTCCAAPPIT